MIAYKYNTYIASSYCCLLLPPCNTPYICNQLCLCATIKRAPMFLVFSSLFTLPSPRHTNKEMVNLEISFKYISLCLLVYAHTMHAMALWPGGGSTRYYEFKVSLNLYQKIKMHSPQLCIITSFIT